MKFNWDNFKEKMTKYYNGTKSIVVIILSIIVGAWGYKTITELQSVKSYQHITNTIEQTSVAVNDRDELIIFNRVTGDYVVYDKNVRLAIFTLQLEKIQTDFKNKNGIKE